MPLDEFDSRLMHRGLPPLQNMTYAKLKRLAEREKKSDAKKHFVEYQNFDEMKKRFAGLDDKTRAAMRKKLLDAWLRKRNLAKKTKGGRYVDSPGFDLNQFDPSPIGLPLQTGRRPKKPSFGPLPFDLNQYEYKAPDISPEELEKIWMRTHPSTNRRPVLKGGKMSKGDMLAIAAGPAGWLYLAGKRRGKKQGREEAMQELTLQNQLEAAMNEINQEQMAGNPGEFYGFDFYDPDMEDGMPPFNEEEAIPEFDPTPVDDLPSVNPFVTVDPEEDDAPPPLPPRIKLQPVAPPAAPAPPPPTKTEVSTGITPEMLQNVRLRPTHSADTALQVEPQTRIVAKPRNVVDELNQGLPKLRHVETRESKSTRPTKKKNNGNDLYSSLADAMSKRRRRIVDEDENDDEFAGFGRLTKKRRRY